MSDLYIKSILPDKYQYKILKSRFDDKCEFDFHCSVQLRVNVQSEESVRQFLEEFYFASGCSFNILSGRQDKHPVGTQSRSTYRGYRKCCMKVSKQRNVASRQPKKKH